MKKWERRAIDLIDRVLRIPLPASGTQSTSIKGMGDYTREMRLATPLAIDLICILRQGEVTEGQYEEKCAQLEGVLDGIEFVRNKGS